MQMLEFIEEYNGALLFAATVILAIVTWRLVRESQVARLSAEIVLQPQRWSGNEHVASSTS